MFVTLYVQKGIDVYQSYIDHNNMSNGNQYPTLVDMLKEAYMIAHAIEVNVLVDELYQNLNQTVCQVWNSAPLGYAFFDFMYGEIHYYTKSPIKDIEQLPWFKDCFMEVRRDETYVLIKV